MQAILKDGSTVELTKECACVTHDGPHWIHTNYLLRQSCVELAEAESRVSLPLRDVPFRGYMRMESDRLKQLEHDMRSEGVILMLDRWPGEPEFTDRIQAAMVLMMERCEAEWAKEPEADAHVIEVRSRGKVRQIEYQFPLQLQLDDGPFSKPETGEHHD